MCFLIPHITASDLIYHITFRTPPSLLPGLLLLRYQTTQPIKQFDNHGAHVVLVSHQAPNAVAVDHTLFLLAMRFFSTGDIIQKLPECAIDNKSIKFNCYLALIMMHSFRATDRQLREQPRRLALITSGGALLNNIAICIFGAVYNESIDR
jgi:hypothetical protein